MLPSERLTRSSLRFQRPITGATGGWPTSTSPVSHPPAATRAMPSPESPAVEPIGTRHVVKQTVGLPGFTWFSLLVACDSYQKPKTSGIRHSCSASFAPLLELALFVFQGQITLNPVWGWPARLPPQKKERQWWLFTGKPTE